MIAQGLAKKRWGLKNSSRQNTPNTEDIEVIISMGQDIGILSSTPRAGSVMSCRSLRVVPKDCQLSTWSGWGPCSTTCGPGTQKRTRSVIVDAVGGGFCDNLEEVRACLNQPECPVDCQLSEWTDWTDCIPDCGDGKQQRTRSIVRESAHGGKTCQQVGPLVEERACKNRECPVDCQHTEWTGWSQCTKTCGGGTETRTRRITRNAAHGGTPCPTNLSETRACNTQGCPVDCAYSEWGNPSACSGEAGKFARVGNTTVPCGKGTRTLTRTITRQAANGGKACTEALQKTEACDTGVACSVDCVVGSFGAFGVCSAECGGGQQTKSRSIITQPLNNGTPCPPLTETQACNTGTCDRDCQVGGWTDWTSCSAACGDGTQSRTRAVTVTKRANGKDCPALREERACKIKECPVDCVVSGWGSWSECSPACGEKREKTRTRTITRQPAHGGAACPPLVEKEDCPVLRCPVDCQTSTWSSWSSCSKACGPGGIQERTRSVSVQPSVAGTQQLAGQPCPVLKETRQCDPKAPECPINCVQSDWGSWSACSTECGKEHTQTRTRTVVTPAAHGGTPCGPATETRKCPFNPCPEDCKTSEWTAYSECSVKCGGGEKTRTRTVLTPAKFGGTCPALSETVTCNETPCPIHCEVNGWEPWTECSKPCGGGERQRSRTVKTEPKFGGTACGPLVEKEACNTNPCPVDCVVNDWTAWSTCSKTCGGGTQKRSRTVKTAAQFGGSPCPTVMEETRACNQQGCPVNCETTPWTEWSTCSAQCGGGRQTRSRSIITPAAHGGTACPTDLVETRDCNTQPCPVDCKGTGEGGKLKWSEWSGCDAECGGGKQERTLPILVEGEHGGIECPSPEQRLQRQACNTDPCPIDCEVGEWTEWSACSASCGQGKRTRTRKVTKQANFTGKACPALVEEESCIDRPCPLDCEVTEWTGWSKCDADCGGGQTKRERAVLTPALHGGRCFPLEETKDCNQEPCPVDCVVGDWGEFGPCSKECGGGRKLRTRSIITPAAHGGKACPAPEELVEEDACNEDPCPTTTQETGTTTATTTSLTQPQEGKEAAGEKGEKVEEESSSSSTGMIIGVVVGAAVLLGGGVWLMRRNRSGAKV